MDRSHPGARIRAVASMIDLSKVSSISKNAIPTLPILKTYLFTLRWILWLRWSRCSSSVSGSRWHLSCFLYHSSHGGGLDKIRYKRSSLVVLCGEMHPNGWNAISAVMYKCASQAENQWMWSRYLSVCVDSWVRLLILLDRAIHDFVIFKQPEFQHNLLVFTTLHCSYTFLTAN